MIISIILITPFLLIMYSWYCQENIDADHFLDERENCWRAVILMVTLCVVHITPYSDNQSISAVRVKYKLIGSRNSDIIVICFNLFTHTQEFVCKQRILIKRNENAFCWSIGERRKLQRSNDTTATLRVIILVRITHGDWEMRKHPLLQDNSPFFFLILFNDVSFVLPGN